MIIKNNNEKEKFKQLAYSGFGYFCDYGKFWEYYPIGNKSIVSSRGA